MKNKIVAAMVLVAFVVAPVMLVSPTVSAAADKTDLLNIFIELGRKVNPAVVNISTTQTVRSGPRGQFFGYPGMPMPNDPFRQFFDDFMGQGGGGGGGGQPMEQKVQSLGSGFIIDPDGLILTNFHVVQNATDIQVQLTESSKKTFKAKVIGSDRRTDIAVIKINDHDKLPSVGLGDSDKVEVGEWVAAFGNPYGHGHSMTKGIISAKNRDIDLENASYPFLQTDASINPGNSGGPLVNTSGEVIGVNSAIDARAQGIGFAIPINVVKKLLPTLKAGGHVTRGFLGVGINNVDDRMVKEFNLKSDHGAIVLSVSPGFPADKAGIKAYDIIVKFDGKDVDDARTLTNIVSDTPVGETKNVDVIREGQAMTLKVKIAERPDETAMNGDQDESGPSLSGLNVPHGLGMSIMDLSPQVAHELDLEDEPTHGVVISNLKPNGLATQAGAEIGDVILDVNRHVPRSAHDALKAFKKGSNSIRVQRGDQTMILFVGG